MSRYSNQTNDDNCPIWRDYPGRGYNISAFEVWQEWSPRAGGSYKITREAELSINTLNDSQKARLTTILVDQQKSGVKSPKVTMETLKKAELRESLADSERRDRLLEFLTNNTSLAEPIEIDGPLPPKSENLSDAQIAGCQAMAWSESTTLEEIWFLLDDLVNNALIEKRSRIAYRVTITGRNSVAQQKNKVDTDQAFVAMWMDPRMDEVYTGAIVPAVEMAGYSPYRVDDEYHLDRIEEKALSEIRRSRFLVVDLTHDERGARGSVYFEAGFALGLGIPIIYCCRKDQGKDVHFDVDHHYRIEWDTHEDLQAKLLSAIKDVVD